MKNKPTQILLIILFLISNLMIKAQYFKRTSKNLIVMNTNSYSLDKNNISFNTLEFGKHYNIFNIYGGFGLMQTINSKSNEVTESAMNLPTNSFLTAGVNANLLSFTIKDLSKYPFCKIINGAFLIGFDANKNNNTELSSGYGYRIKGLFDLNICKSGANKNNVAFSNSIQLGYAYSVITTSSNIKIQYHSIMLNFIFIKYRVYKFANW